MRSHAIILQTGNSVHSLLRHILLSQHDSQLLGTVVTVVEEDNYITFLDSTVEVRVYNRFDELIGYTLIVRLPAWPGPCRKQPYLLRLPTGS